MRSALLLFVATLSATTGLAAQGVPDGSRDLPLSITVATGFLAASPLVRDRIVSEVPFEMRAAAGGVTARQNPAPLLGLGVRKHVTPRLAVELEGGWSFARMDGSDAIGTWRIQELGVGYGSIALVRGIGRRYLVRGGAGAIRYSSEGEWPMTTAVVTAPLLALGAGMGAQLGGIPLSLEAVGQLHPFTPSAEADAGTVFRAGLLVRLQPVSFR